MDTHNHPSHRLEVRDLHVHYGRICALEGVSFTVECGSRVAIVGPNGAGKSTLLRSIAGLLPNPAGSIDWCGAPLTAAVRNREFAYLPQREEIDWSFPITVRGMVEMGRYPHTGLWGRFGATDRREVERALASLELSELADRQIGELSGGQQQRAFLARALAGRAHVLLLDEPFTGLDREATRRLFTTLERLAGDGHLILASHHEISTARELFDHALLLRTHQLAFGPAAEVLSDENLVRAYQ